MRTMAMALASLVMVAAVLGVAQGAVVDFGAVGGISGEESLEIAVANTVLMTDTLSLLAPGDTFVVPADRVFFMMGGVYAQGLEDVVISIDGTLKFSDEHEEWPRKANTIVEECITFDDFVNVTITSASERGVLDGNGNRWWSIGPAGYLIHVENRPRLLAMNDGTDILVEKLVLLDSPFWTTYFRRMQNFELRFSDISARRTKRLGHALLDLTAFNTDGFDVTGDNIYLHDLTVYSQDDCIAIKDGSTNVLVERVNASGVGLTIGSIGASFNDNITFRDSYLQDSHKGIYLKFRTDPTDGGVVGSISNVLFENIVMDGTEQWPIWIGPAQQSSPQAQEEESAAFCLANPCSICFPIVPGAECNGLPDKTYSNIVLRNVLINNPLGSPGIILGSPETPMQGVVFDNVRVNKCAEDLPTFAESFPDLPIHDVYVTYFGLIVASAVLVLVLVPCFFCARAGCCTKQYWREHRKVKIGCIALLVPVAIVGVLAAGWMISVNAKMGNQDEYYLCEGVNGGVATGNTWPVPPCFEDQTDGSGEGECPANVAGIVLGTLFALLVVAVAATVLFLKKNRPEKYNALKERLPCARSDEDSATIEAGKLVDL